MSNKIEEPENAELCPRCSGEGDYKEDNGYVACPICKRKGWVLPNEFIICDKCKGNGHIKPNTKTKQEKAIEYRFKELNSIVKMSILQFIRHKIRVWNCSRKNIKPINLYIVKGLRTYMCDKNKSVICASKAKVKKNYCSNCNPTIPCKKWSPNG